MVHCVVKRCRNNSEKQNKLVGITFHKFPADASWKYKWIKIIRACRAQEKWLPTKSSVVCSVHFDKNDIYTAQGGNRRLVKDAVPKLKLNEYVKNTTSKKKKNESIEPEENVDVSVQTTYAGASGNDGPEVITGDCTEPAGDQLGSVVIKVEPTETTDATGTDAGHIQNVIIKVESKPPAREPSPFGISPDPLDPAIDIYQLPHPCLYKKDVKKKDEQLKICRRKVKILLQKVHRLQKRNLTLKNILKEIKSKKLIHRDVFRQLTASLASSENEKDIDNVKDTSNDNDDENDNENDNDNDNYNDNDNEDIE